MINDKSENWKEITNSEYEVLKDGIEKKNEENSTLNLQQTV